jgi:hypothetical protein
MEGNRNVSRDSIALGMDVASDETITLQDITSVGAEVLVESRELARVNDQVLGVEGGLMPVVTELQSFEVTGCVKRGPGPVRRVLSELALTIDTGSKVLLNGAEYPALET